MTFEEFCVENGKRQKEEVQQTGRYSHGMAGTRLYRIWSGMKIRTSENAQPHNKVAYFDRGIKVCKEWERFETFLFWAYISGYNKDLTIDRIDVDKGYSPDNCRWVPLKWQNNNKQSSWRIEYQGQTKTVGEWEHFFGVRREYIRGKLNHGWTFEEIVENIKNPTTLNKNNKSGIKGVLFDNNHSKWRAYISVGGKRVEDRVFRTKEEAIEARKQMELRYWGYTNIE